MRKKAFFFAGSSYSLARVALRNLELYKFERTCCTPPSVHTPQVVQLYIDRLEFKTPHILVCTAPYMFNSYIFVCDRSKSLLLRSETFYIWLILVQTKRKGREQQTSAFSVGIQLPLINELPLIIQLLIQILYTFCPYKKQMILLQHLSVCRSLHLHTQTYLSILARMQSYQIGHLRQKDSLIPTVFYRDLLQLYTCYCVYRYFSL